MTIYSVHLLPKDKKFDNVIILKEGLATGCFLFGIFWAIYHKLWKVFAVFLLSNIILVLMANNSIITDIQGVLYWLLVNFTVSLFVNDYWRLILNQNGYKMDIISAKNTDAALDIFIKNFVTDNQYIHSK